MAEVVQLHTREQWDELQETRGYALDVLQMVYDGDLEAHGEAVERALRLCGRQPNG